MTKPYLSHRFIANCFIAGNFKKGKWRYLIPADSQIHNHMLIPNYQDIIFQDFRYFDEFECYQVIKIERLAVASEDRIFIRSDPLIANGTYPIFLSMSPMIEDMSHLVKEEERLLNSDGCNADDPESSGISNPLKVPSAEQVEPAISLTVEIEIPTEEGIDYKEVFAPVARIEAIRLFLAYASFMGFIVYQMDVKSAFLYGTIDEEVYVMQPLGFQDSEFPDRVYKVEKAMYGLHQAPRAWYCTLSKEFEALMHEKFQMSDMGELTFFFGLQVLQKKDGIFLSQDKYVGDILKKFGYSDVRLANTPMDKENPWGKDGPGKDVELHLYRSMIGSLMYLTASRPDIMFAVCVCARHQVTPKECHLHAVKRIFRYLKDHPKLGLWYFKDSPFDLVAYSNSDYGGATQDRKSTTREYVAAASGCGQVLWKQNQMLDYGRYTRRAIWIAQSKALSPATAEPASLSRDDRQGEAFPTVSSLDARHDRENINKTSALPHESSPRVTFFDADKGSMQQRFQELMNLCTSLQRQQTQMAAKLKYQDLEISSLKARVKFLEDKDRGSAEPPQNNAPIKWGIMEIGEEVGVDKSTELGSNDTDEMVHVLSSMEAANILTSEVTAVSVSPVAGVSTKGVPNVSGLFPTASAIFTTASVRVNEQLARDSEIARLYAKEELKMMIKGIDRSNEVIAKHLQEYEQAAADLSVGEKIELINEMMKYQDHHTKILKYWAQQSKPLSKKEEREFYMFVARSHARWKTRHFKGMTLEEIKAAEDLSEMDMHQSFSK
nr:hypothetical protein [Tanacetum cinerariifolium]